MLQHPQHQTEIFAMPPLQLARYHSFGKGHGHARSVLGPERGAEKQRPPRHETMDLQDIRDGSKQAQKLDELCIWRHRHSYADSNTYSMHNASPAMQHPLKRIESRRSANECKIAPAAGASWSAQDQPFGDRHRHTGTAPGPAQSSNHSSQTFATQEMKWQISHRERAAATYTQVWAPRFHPTGGSFSQQKPDNDKATNSTQDALRIGTIIHTNGDRVGHHFHSSDRSFGQNSVRTICH